MAGGWGEGAWFGGLESGTSCKQQPCQPTYPPGCPNTRITPTFCVSQRSSPCPVAGASEPRNLAYMTRLGMWSMSNAMEVIGMLCK